MKKSEEIYVKRVNRYEVRAKRQARLINQIVRLRLVVGLITVALAILLENRRTSYPLWGMLIVALIAFIVLIYQHQKNKKRLEKSKYLKEINECHLKRIQGGWQQFPQRGDEFLEATHPYSNDLDVFGQGSLFQWINSCGTQAGKRRLARFFTEDSPNLELIKERQRAIQELAKRRWWRQRLQLEGKYIQNEPELNELIQWGRERNQFYCRKDVQFFVKALPIITIASGALALVQVISPGIFILLLLLHLILLMADISKRNRTLSLAYRFKVQIRIYRKILDHFEGSTFSSNHINELKGSLKNQMGITARGQLTRLEKIVDQVANRNNMAFFPINLLTLWDYQCTVALEKWRQQSGESIGQWLSVIGEVEALSSLATIPHDYPQWAIPNIVGEPSVFSAQSLGHPLLTNRQVVNDVAFDAPAQVLLITGSNMSGKSTLLRTIGVNLVLAYAGAPICGKALTSSGFRLYTCMRVSDNLEKSISSFYAELMRIREIVEAAKGQGQVLFMLDEIFKGTNSHDRHLGARLLIKQLIQYNGLGLVSTHDLELADLEQESSGKVKNYHFQETYQGNEIKFDYRLRPGVSTTRNALYLMKLAGVEIEVSPEIYR